jgi:pimeloyl-ACP methyl ester carboxylesterase
VRTLRIRHDKVTLALHALRERGDARPLLLLHGRGGRAPGRIAPPYAAWPGPVWALDFTGHGASTVPAGGGYTAEILMADADTALASIGAATLAGHGLGGYVALLLAGARPHLVRGALVCDGPGLAGGGPRPVTPSILHAAGGGPPDPYALLELARDVRPPDYATSFVRQAAQLSGLDRPLSVCAVERPDWLATVVEEPGVEVTTPHEALLHYARVD